ncbi:hypothetical protein DVH05_014862 [Phytophthora capsici]|nr:hypothetical protein DVH05_027267 [Phytophthora capsici]KAG1698359.1 hypothetical protein DVH05_014862 [Phytophthora capsici]|eukprot:jgi/Phyca11/12711/fgenesh1_pg.PHYCAscaffold_1_\
MSSRRMPKSMIEKREVNDWIEANCPQATSRAATYFKNTRGWVVSPTQVRYWWKQRDGIHQASPTQLRLSGGGAKPQLDAIEDTLFYLIIQRRVLKLKVSRK